MNTTANRPRRRDRQVVCHACAPCQLGDRHWTRFCGIWRDIAAYKTRMADLQAGRGWVRMGVQLTALQEAA